MPSSNPEIQSAVAATIARSVGETVAQRAFTLLGSSIVEQILAGAADVTTGQEIERYFRDTQDSAATERAAASTKTNS